MADAVPSEQPDNSNFHDPESFLSVPRTAMQGYWHPMDAPEFYGNGSSHLDGGVNTPTPHSTAMPWEKTSFLPNNESLHYSVSMEQEDKTWAKKRLEIGHSHEGMLLKRSCERG
jgi:hypothetical protein